MIHALRAGMLALATIALLNTMSTVQAREPGSGASGQAAAIPALDIGGIERALMLTPEQKIHWPAVRSALRGLSGSKSGGPGARIAALQRLALVAQPLLAVLTEEQKAAARGLAAEMGLGGVVVAALR